MPSTIPSYLYSLLATLLIGTILVTTISLETMVIRSTAKEQQLRNIQQYVAAEALNLMSQTAINNQTVTRHLDIPSAIGNERFWIALNSNSQTAWVETGFGLTVSSTDKILNIAAAKVAASGNFTSGAGRPLLRCHLENQTFTLTLTQE